MKDYNTLQNELQDIVNKETVSIDSVKTYIGTCTQFLRQIGILNKRNSQDVQLNLTNSLIEYTTDTTDANVSVDNFISNLKFPSDWDTSLNERIFEEIYKALQLVRPSISTTSPKQTSKPNSTRCVTLNDVEQVKGTTDIFVGKSGSNFEGKAYIKRKTLELLFDVLPSKVIVRRKGRGKVYTVSIKEEINNFTFTELRTGKWVEKYDINLGCNSNLAIGQWAQIIAHMAIEEAEIETEVLQVKNVNEEDPCHATYEAVLEASDFDLPTIYTTFRYIFVRRDKYIGIWLATCSRDKWSIKRLVDFDIKVISKVSPSSTSRFFEYSLVLEITDKNGEIYPFTINSENSRKDALKEYVRDFGTYPESIIDKQHLNKAIQELSLQSHVIRQTSVDTLGWNKKDGKDVWVCANGCEDITGFKEGDKAPYKFSGDESIYHGYYGSDVETPNDDILHLMFEQSNTDENVCVIDDALLGYTTACEYKNRPNAGNISFPIEVLGFTRKGKSVTSHRHSTAYGINFYRGKGTLLNNVGCAGKGDTPIGTVENLSALKYVWGSDYDHSKKVEDDGFKDEYKARISKNAMYANDASSTIGKRSGGSKQRAKQTGGLVRTGETDFCQHIFDLSQELRVETFVWKEEYVANDYNVSVAINEKRIEYYTWHVWFRRWQISKTDIQLAKCWEQVISDTCDLFSIHDFDGMDLPFEHTQILIAGLLIWKRFLQEWFPTCFMIDSMDMRIKRLIKNRIERCKYLINGVKQEQVSHIADTAIEILRNLLHHGIGYLRTHYNTLLNIGDRTAYNLTIPEIMYGYKGRMKDSKADVYGYFINQGKNIALHTEIVIAAIQNYASKNNIKIGTKDEILDALEHAGYITSFIAKDGKKRYGTKPRIAGNQKLLWTIPFDIVYPPIEEGPCSNEDDYKDIPNNIVNIEDHRQEEVTEESVSSEASTVTSKKTKKTPKKPLVKTTVKTEQTLDEMLRGDIV